MAEAQKDSENVFAGKGIFFIKNFISFSAICQSQGGQF
jgi:hypothetical protein